MSDRGTVDPGRSPEPGSTVFHDPGWAASVTGKFGHYVTKDAMRALHCDRPAGYGMCGVHGFIDEQGLADAGRLPMCGACVDRGAPLPEMVEWP